MKVSVVIPTKNAGQLFKKVLTSVFAQKTKWPFEVIVVDSGSNDETIKTIRKFPLIKLIQIKKEDFGHGKTRNLAISKAKGKYIAMITQDALPANNNWLSELVMSIESDSRIAGVFGRHIAYPEASKYLKKELDVHFSNFKPYLVKKSIQRFKYRNNENYRKFLYFFSDNNALIKKDIWKKIPYPDVDFAEDQAWARLIIEAGYLKAYAPNAAVYHSHNYGFIETFQRSFEETYYLTKLFKYQKNRSIINATYRFFYLSIRNMKWILTDKNDLTLQDLKDLSLIPVYAFMKILGAYIALFVDNINPRLITYLTRDGKIKDA